MANVFENRVVRPVRIFADRLTFDGLLNIYEAGLKVVL